MEAMARSTFRLAHRREALVSEPRVVHVRLMAGMALAAAGGVAGMLLLMDGSMEREAEALERAWAAGPGPAGCAVAPPVGSAEAHMAALRPAAVCVLEPQPRYETVAAARPVAAAQPAAASPSKRASPVPTYVRIGGPKPEPDPVALALETLRGGI